MNNIITIRASSLSEIFDCPARWQAKYLLGMTMPSSGAATLGTAVHAGTACFVKTRWPGVNANSINDSAGAVVDAIYKPEQDVDWGEDKPQDAEKIALALHARYCTEIAPTQEYLGVEIKCERLEITDLGIALTGTTDRIRKTATGNGIADLKTGKTAVSADGSVKTSGHAFQLGVYELLAEHASGIPITAPAQIIGLSTGKTAAAQRAGTGEIIGARETLLGGSDDMGVLQHASKIIHSGDFFGNPRSQLCGERYCPNYKLCRFRK
jgi:hypothetical protein